MSMNPATHRRRSTHTTTTTTTPQPTAGKKKKRKKKKSNQVRAKWVGGVDRQRGFVACRWRGSAA